MSIFRTLERVAGNDVYQVTEHTRGPAPTEHAAQPASAPKRDWTKQRKALHIETLLPSTVRWMKELPLGFQPVAIGTTFPRIANTLAAFWREPDTLVSYLSGLIVDQRGGRKGFPIHVLRELHALRTFYATLHPDRF